MLTAFWRFLGLSTKTTKKDVQELLINWKASPPKAGTIHFPYFVANVQVYERKVDALITCTKTRRRVARVELTPKQEPKVSWGVLWQ